MKEKIDRLKKASCLCLFILLPFFYSLHAQNLLPSGIKEADVALELEAIISNTKVEDAGIAVSVFSNEQTIFESYSGFGNKVDNLKIDRNTVFEWGSITKLLVWVSFMQLNEAGKLDLNQDIRAILSKGFFTKLKYDEAITPLHLMNHTAGFQDVLVGLFAPVEDISCLEDALKEMEPPQIERPGTISSYSNWGAALGGLIVEKISGKPFYQYVHEHIFIPLGMNHTALLPDLSDNLWVKETRGKMAGYDLKGELMELSDLGVPLYPAGQATGTLEDITRFAKALNDKSEESKLFQKQSTMLLFQQATLSFREYALPINAHGMWATNYKVPTLGHMGGTMKFFSSLSFHPESGYGCVILSNNKAVFGTIVDIPTVLFGRLNSFAPDNSLSEDTFKGIDGFYIDARRVYKSGFMKVLSLLSLTKLTEQEDNKFKISSSIGGGRVEKNEFGIFEHVLANPMLPVEIPQMLTMGKLDDGRNIMHRYYGDAIQISGKKVTVDIIFFSLFFIALLYAIAIFLLNLVRFIVRFIKRLMKKQLKQTHPQRKRVRRLNFIASCLIIAVWINIGALFSRTFSFSVTRLALQQNLIINTVFAVLLFAFGVFMFYNFRRKKVSEEESKKSFRFKQIDSYLMMFFLFATSINIFYWDLWRFWL